VSRITAAICSYERYDLLPQAIDSLLRQTLPATDYRILVVDNSPDRDRAQNFALRYREHASVSYVIEARPGLSNARNVAAAQCESELLAFIDDDAEAAPNWLASLVEAFASDARVAAVGGKVVPRWMAPRPPWLHDRALGYLSLVDWGGRRRKPAAGEWLAGTNLAFRCDRLRALGGFALGLGRDGSADHLLSNEEIELLQRLRDAGDVILYAPEAEVTHLVPPERLTQVWFHRRVAWQALSNHFTLAGRIGSRRPTEEQRALLGLTDPRFAALTAPTDDPRLFLDRLYAIHLLLMDELAARARGASASGAE